MTQSFANNIDNSNNNNTLALVVVGLEKKVEYICKENHSLYFHSIFKKMSSYKIKIYLNLVLIY